MTKVNRANTLKKSLQSQQKMISTYKDDSKLASLLNLKISQGYSKEVKPFSDSKANIVLWYLLNWQALKRKHSIEHTNLSRFTVA